MVPFFIPLVSQMLLFLQAGLPIIWDCGQLYYCHSQFWPSFLLEGHRATCLTVCQGILVEEEEGIAQSDTKSSNDSRKSTSLNILLFWQRLYFECTHGKKKKKKHLQSTVKSNPHYFDQWAIKRKVYSNHG